MLRMEDMLEVVTVRDVSCSENYSPGWYNDRKPVYGLKLRPVKGSFLETLEIKAKGKFKLENDSENYVQEVRLMLWESINDYYKSDNASEDDERAKEWIFTDVSNRLTDLARKTKSVSYYDWEKGEFIINQFDYFEHSEASSELLEEYINNIGLSKMIDNRTDFMKWFDYKKYDILTPKQIEYIDNDNPKYHNRQSKYYMKNAIIKKIDKYYHDDSVKEYRSNKIKNKLEIVQDIINGENGIPSSSIISNLHMSDCCEFIVDRIYKELDMKDCKEFTKVLNKEIKINLLLITKVLQILRLVEGELLKSLNSL